MSRTRFRLAFAALAAALVAISAGAISAAAHDAADNQGHEHATADVHSRDGAGRALAELRRDLAPYKDVEKAYADGFVPVSECTESPLGGMGVHFLNPARAMAPVDPKNPAILLYSPTDDGGYRLIGAEWFAADADQNVSTDGDRPSLWGRPFDGPMAGHDPGMPVHYDLHVWLYDSNPAGVFAAWNPSVGC
jgi:hypothetical protein